MNKLNATQGSLAKSIFIFTIPLILSTILQNLFSIADKAVLGNMAGSVAVASIAATGTITTLIINGAVGLSSGTAIVLARFLGQRDEEKIRATIDTSLITSIIFGVLCAAAGLLLAPFFLRATKCPGECYDGALIYMQIVLAGAPATLLYNFGSAILRAMGDTQKTLLYISIAGVVNVVLNILLCLILPQKVIAVAVATMVSNLISALLTLHRIFYIRGKNWREIFEIRFSFPDFLRLIRFGIPASVSNLVLPLGNLQIATAINSYGPSAIAGHAAAASAETVPFAFSAGFGSAAMTFMGQNIGAGNVDRVRKSFWLCMLYTSIITGTLGILTYWTGELWIGIIVGMSAKAAIEYGILRMFYVAQFMIINAVSTILISSLKAFGYPIFTSITNIFFNLGFRVFWMQFIYPLSPKFSTIMLCYTVAWTLNLLFYIIATVFVYRRYVKKGICKRI